MSSKVARKATIQAKERKDDLMILKISEFSHLRFIACLLLISYVKDQSNFTSFGASDVKPVGKTIRRDDIQALRVEYLEIGSR